MQTKISHFRTKVSIQEDELIVNHKIIGLTTRKSIPIIIKERTVLKMKKAM